MYTPGAYLFTEAQDPQGVRASDLRVLVAGTSDIPKDLSTPELLAYTWARFLRDVVAVMTEDEIRLG